MIPDIDDALMYTPPALERKSIVRGWGLQDKTPLVDQGLQNGQGVYNRALLRPAYSRFRLNRRMDFVAPAKKTPWPTVNWVPNPPHRTLQQIKGGGQQFRQPGQYTVMQMQQYQRSIPRLQSGLSGAAAHISNVWGAA